MMEEQQALWMGFIREDKTYTKYYDGFGMLLGTGMRDFCVPIMPDFENEELMKKTKDTGCRVMIGGCNGIRKIYRVIFG